MSDYYDLYRSTMFGPVLVAANVLPTPFMFDAVTRRGFECYRDSIAGQNSINVDTWRARDDQYDLGKDAKYIAITAITRHKCRFTVSGGNDWGECEGCGRVRDLD
jgi:hypothetical protein